MSTSITTSPGTSPGRIIAISTRGDDVIGFDPARDKLDFGDVSVHNFIVVDTPTGVGFMDPWSGETVIIRGVSLGQLTINSFTPIQNDHLRQCLSGALAWEQGITPAVNTVYARSHELGQVDRVTFNPATDVVDFRFYGSREQISMRDGAEGVIISNAGTGQALVLLGVIKAQLTVQNFLFYPAEVREDRVHLQLGIGTVPDAQVKPQGLPIAGTTAWPTGIGAGAPPSGGAGETFLIDWNHSTQAKLDFDPVADKLDFGWFKAHEITLAEVNGSTVITIEGNRQSYTLTGIGLGALGMGNIVARDPALRAEWQAALDAAPALPSVSISDAQVTEGDAGSAALSFTVTLTAASAMPVSVSYSTLNGSARAEDDYTPSIGTLTFAPGETRKTISVAVLGDRLVELEEALTVQLSAPVGARILSGSGTGRIRDNDVDPAPATPPSISITDYVTTEGDAELTHMRVVLTLSKASSVPVTVRYTSEDSTATGDVDYELLSGTVTFAPGETRQTIHAHVFGDRIVEGTESYRIRLSAPTNATLADDLGVVTITNDDMAALPSLSIADASIAEGNSGTRVMSLTVTLSPPASGPVTVGYSTADDTARAGSDYTAKSGTLSFATGETSKTIQVVVRGDTAVEGNEAFAIRLSNPTGATIADAAAIATIINEDQPPAVGAGLEYSISSAWNSGFTAAMTVEAGSSALNGWTAQFRAPFTITNIWNAEIVSHVGDLYVVRNLSYNARVPAGGETSFGFQASGGAPTAVTGLVLNGAPVASLPSLRIADATLAEGASGSANMAFAVTLSAAATAPVTVNYTTSNGTATAGSDYTAKTGSLTFAAGETSKTIQVAIAGDRVVEANERFNLTLSGASGASIADGQAIGSIVNDDQGPALPRVSVGDAAVLEGASGTANLGFVITLSAPASAPVTVNYATSNGTATAGSDYMAASGSVTFAAGETSRLVTIAVRGDTAVEASETLRLTLANPSGAAIGTGTGIGTIRNDDLPGIAIKDASIQEGNPAEAGGWLSTRGNQIVDASGQSVQIAGVNWFGFEGDNMSPNGLWTRGYKEMMQQMVELDFNTIRLPFSSEMLHATGEARGIDFSKNPDLRGLTPLQVMDRIVAHAEEIGLRVILDHHRSDAGAGTSPNGLWYDAKHTEAAWVDDWEMLAQRYAGNTAVIGADLHNEPHAGIWGGGGAKDWAAAAELAGNAIGAVNPNWLIFVEGVGSYQGSNYWWGGNLMGVRDRPIELDLPNKLVYSPHDYPNSVYPQPWFQGADFAAKLPAKFDQMWGYIFKEGIAPIYLGEFGTKLTDPKDAPWFEAITSYLSGDFDNDGSNDLASGQQGISWTFWSWNPNSGDTGGILKDDWRTVNDEKMAYLKPITFDMPAGGGGTAQASFEVSLSAPATEAVSVAWRTVAGTAGAADFTAAQGTLSFAVGEQTKLIRVAVASDAVDEANEAFTIQLSNPVGASITRGTAQGSILDDDPAAGGAALTLGGTALEDRLTGGTAADAIFGRGGSDMLTGGGGADRFHFTPGETGRDTVTDFNALDGGAAEGDLLVIEAPALGRFAYLGSAAFSGGGDNSEARIQGDAVLIDVNGDAAADVSVTLTGLVRAGQLSAGDFLFG